MTAEDAGTPVVLLHGVGLDRTVWARVEDRLDRPTVALDLPGHGEQPPLTEATTLEDMAADIAARMPAGPVHLVGFSLGSLIAQQLAATLPGRVRTLTCVSSVAARTAEEAAAVRARLETAYEDFAGSMERALDRWFPAGESPETADWRAETRAVLLANDPDSYRHAYAVFATGDRAIAPRLPAITAPTLAITGEQDPGSTPDMSRRLGALITGTEVVIVPEARHMLPVTHPETLARRVSALIDDSAVPTDRSAVLDDGSAVSHDHSERSQR